MAKIEMTEEMAAQLAGLLPITPDTRKAFTPSIYLAESFPKQFAPSITVRPLTRIEKTVFVTSSDPDESNRQIFNAIEKCENLWNVSERKVYDEFTFDLFMSMHYSVINDVKDEVRKLSGLSDVEKLGLK